ncbi:hypothetical protein [Stenotrophomonas maltophilia]|uniref:hypothetical protein n=1 Tax=Stenotrophomonas maltophilia TaxID=40324 RepID=UPI0015DE9220|nr:hypothetical protein [Stenotrophomonas maltophilia]
MIKPAKAGFFVSGVRVSRDGGVHPRMAWIYWMIKPAQAGFFMSSAQEGRLFRTGFPILIVVSGMTRRMLERAATVRARVEWV